MRVLWDVFIAFFRANIVTFGGGQVAIPLVETEVVNNFKWMTAEEFANVIAMGNALPGPIAPKLAGYVGYQVAGPWGAIVALFGAIGPTVLLMIGLGSLLARYKDNPVVEGMISGVRPVVWVLFLLLALDYLRFVKSVPTGIIAAAAFVLVYVLKLYPVVAMVLGLVAGGVFLR